MDELTSAVKDEDIDAVASLWGANYVMSQWMEPVMGTKRLNIAVLLPSGTTENNFKVSVVPHGRILEVAVNFPKPMTHMPTLHRYFDSRLAVFDSAEISLAINGFENALKSRKEHMDSNVVNSTQIMLPSLKEMK